MRLRSAPAHPIQPLPFGVYLGSVIILSLAGLSVSVHLAISHYRLFTDIGYQSFCALTQSINCDTVSQSRYAILGNLPAAVWGMLGYALFLSLSLFCAAPAGRGIRIWALCLSVALVFSASSLVFAAISTFYVGSYCILCIATYGINLLLVYLAWLIRRRFPGGPFWTALLGDFGFLWKKRRYCIPVFLSLGIAALTIHAVYPPYWKISPPAPSTAIKTGITPEGHPWIGAEMPEFVIIEFSDYLCFQCRKMHYYLRQLISRHPEKLRLIHYNFPMDHELNPLVTEPFHVGSGNMALFAIHALAAGKFWEMNDRLYEAVDGTQMIAIQKMATQIGLDAGELSASLQHKPYRQMLMRDIREGLKHQIAGTPSYLIGGEVFQGSIPAEILRTIITQDSPEGDEPIPERR
jgi:uncharacterized membrane protein/protein-disulfide isomerase